MKYSNRKKEFVKLTIRVQSDELENFKKVCCILGLSANNQINIMIREFLYRNRSLFDNNSCQTIIDFCDKENIPK